MRYRLFCRYTHFNFSAIFLTLFIVFINIHKFVNWICILDFCVKVLLVRGHRDSRATLMPIYGDLCQIKLKGITNENRLVTHLGFTSGRHNDVIKKASIVLVQFARYVHCKLWRSRFSCILFANFSRNIPIYNLRGLVI